LRRKGMLGFGSTAIPMAGHTPTFSSSNTPHSHHFRLGFFLDYNLSIAATTSSTFEANAQKKIQNPTSIIKISSFICNTLIEVFVLTYCRFQVGIKTLASQADRAPARSITLGDCSSDCIGARALHV
jgi:hypothetical protein